MGSSVAVASVIWALAAVVTMRGRNISISGLRAGES